MSGTANPSNNRYYLQRIEIAVVVDEHLDDTARLFEIVSINSIYFGGGPLMRMRSVEGDFARCRKARVPSKKAWGIFNDGS